MFDSCTTRHNYCYSLSLSHPPFLLLLTYACVGLFPLYLIYHQKGFRLFLTTEPHPKFPRTFLELCTPISYEVPPGAKLNLQRTMYSWPSRYFESQETPSAHPKLLFALAWFHAIIQERRTYIPQVRGWRSEEEKHSDLMNRTQLGV